VATWTSCSGLALFERLEAVDHRFDARARLFVLRQQVRALGHELLLALAQAAVLVREALREQEQLLHAVGEFAHLLLPRLAAAHGQRKPTVWRGVASICSEAGGGGVGSASAKASPRA